MVVQNKLALFAVVSLALLAIKNFLILLDDPLTFLIDTIQHHTWESLNTPYQRMVKLTSFSQKFGCLIALFCEPIENNQYIWELLSADIKNRIENGEAHEYLKNNI